MKIGIITDSHLYPTPGDGRAFAFHNPYPMARAQPQFEAAIARCVDSGVDVIAMLGDLTHIGDDASMALGIQLLAQSGKPVWISPGNHDCTVRPEAMADAVALHGAGRVTLLSNAGTLVGGMRVAGLALTGENNGNSAGAQDVPPVAAWGDDMLLWAIHHPGVSLRERCAAENLKYAGDLSNYAAVAAAVHGRSAPTLLIHGHLHLRDENLQGAMLQLSFASLIEPPHEIGLLTLTQDSGTLRVTRSALAVAANDAERLPLLSPDSTAWTFSNGHWTRAEVAA